MQYVDVYEAGAALPRLIAAAEAGEEIVISREGRPVAKLIRYVAGSEPRKPGAWAGQVVMAPDFDAPLDGGDLAEFS